MLNCKIESNLKFKIFLDYLRFEGSLEEQAKEFLLKSTESHQWAEDVLIGFISYELERVKKRDIRMYYS
jgi:hypothetical protein